MFNYRRLLKFRLFPSRPADCVAPAAGALCGIKHNVALCRCGEAKPTPSLAANTWSEKRSVGCSRMTSAERSELFGARVGSALPVSAVGRTRNKTERSNRRAGEVVVFFARSGASCVVEWRGAASQLRSQATSPAAVCGAWIAEGCYAESRSETWAAVCRRHVSGWRGRDSASAEVSDSSPAGRSVRLRPQGCRGAEWQPGAQPDGEVSD